MAKSHQDRAQVRGQSKTSAVLKVVQSRGLESLRNLAPESATMLVEAGVDTRAKLAEIGAVGAYVAVKKKGLNPTLNLLYAVEGALRGLPWTELPYHIKASLTLEADAYLDAEGMK